MRKIGATVGVLAAVAVVLVVTSTHAQQPSIADAAICNEAAQAKAGAGSASPAIPAPPTRPPSTANAPTLEPKAGTRTDPSGSIIVQSSDRCSKAWRRTVSRMGRTAPPTVNAWRPG